ncbi:MAG: AraC-like DNA-binding protein [Desulforhopalus sp.]|jgi:AraC-like DNA-binding protein
MENENFFKDKRMPFAECRYSRSSMRQFKSHMHKTFSIGGVDSGEVVYSVAGERKSLTVGALALINPEVLHSCNSVGENERSYYMLYLDVDWCLQVQRAIWNVSTFNNVTAIRLDGQDYYQEYIKTMKLLMAKGAHLLNKEHQLVEFVTKIFTHACNPETPLPVVSQGIEELKEKLGSNLRADLTLNSIANGMAVNPYTLLRRFKKIVGLTPHAYRMNCRIEKAKICLQQGIDIAETALECGFFDQSHLHRHFKAMSTVTPQEYRVNFVQ